MMAAPAITGQRPACSQCGDEPVNAGGLLGDDCWWANVETSAATPEPPRVTSRAAPELLTLF